MTYVYFSSLHVTHSYKRRHCNDTTLLSDTVTPLPPASHHYVNMLSEASYAYKTKVLWDNHVRNKSTEEKELFLSSNPKSIILRVVKSIEGFSKIVDTFEKGPLRFNAGCIAYVLSSLFVKEDRDKGSQEMVKGFINSKLKFMTPPGIETLDSSFPDLFKNLIDALHEAVSNVRVRETKGSGEQINAGAPDATPHISEGKGKGKSTASSADRYDIESLYILATLSALVINAIIGKATLQKGDRGLLQEEAIEDIILDELYVPCFALGFKSVIQTKPSNGIQYRFKRTYEKVKTVEEERDKQIMIKLRLQLDLPAPR